MVVAGARMAGELVAAQAGLSTSTLLDPETGEEIGPLGRLYGWVALVAFLGLGGPLILVRVVAESYQAVPAGGLLISAETATMAFAQVGRSLELALQAAAPVALALALAGIIMGWLSRAASSLPFVALALPIRTLIGVVLADARIGHVVRDVFECLGKVSLGAMRKTKCGPPGPPFVRGEEEHSQRRGNRRAAMSEDRTQPPSKRRRQMARQHGQAAHSPELTAAAGWLVAVVVLGFAGDNLTIALTELVRGSLSNPARLPDDATAVAARVRNSILGVGWPLAAILGGFAGGAFAAHQLQVRGLWATSQIVPDPSRLWRFSKGPGSSTLLVQSTWSLAKGIILVAAAACALGAGWSDFLRQSSLEGPALAQAAGQIVLRVSWALAGALLALGLVDYVLRYRRFEAMLRTTPEEQREDQQVMEGDPAARRSAVRGPIDARRLSRAACRRGMAALRPGRIDAGHRRRAAAAARLDSHRCQGRHWPQAAPIGRGKWHSSGRRRGAAQRRRGGRHPARRLPPS